MFFCVFKLLKNEIVLFRHFGSKFLHSKWKGVYKRAIISALEVSRVQCRDDLLTLGPHTRRMQIKVSNP